MQCNRTVHRFSSCSLTVFCSRRLLSQIECPLVVANGKGLESYCTACGEWPVTVAQPIAQRLKHLPFSSLNDGNLVPKATAVPALH